MDLFRGSLMYLLLSGAILSGATGAVMGSDPQKMGDGEDMWMFMRRALHEELVSSDIALRLAEMVFVEVYGRKYVDERSPLVVVDRRDRWEITSREGIPVGERLRITIDKTNARILELVSW
jgi:NTF2 fold immunity protein of polymorphic toxin system component